VSTVRGTRPAATAPPVPCPVMNRRTWTLIVSMLLAGGLGVLSGIGEVPYVTLGPGPTYDTLGDVEGRTVVSVDGQTTHPTAGRLNMTTVSVSDNVTLLDALGKWVSGRYAIIPREEIFPPTKTEEQVEQENAQAFQDSETNAEAAALSYLKYPTKVIVNTVVSGAPAEGKLKPGDELITINGVQIGSADQMREVLGGTRPGTKVEVRFQRGPTTGTASVMLAKHPEDEERGFLGVAPANHPDVPFEITINVPDVGGPSAGLMLALAIVDKLSPGELNGGQFVAGTGEINSDGVVGPIGGIPFKMAAASEAGATVFLVPADNCLEAKQRSPEGLRLVRVGTLADAVGALDLLRAGRDAPSC
jgi:Lon-like protease